MSQENVEDYRRSSDAWTRGDREAWLSDIPADWEFRATGLFSGCRATVAVLPGPGEAARVIRVSHEPRRSRSARCRISRVAGSGGGVGSALLDASTRRMSSR
jgi:ketosteroid isomerase-like protein